MVSERDVAITMLKKRKEALEAQLRDIERDIRNHELAIIEEKYGVTKGCVVKYKGQTYRVAKIKAFSAGGRPWLKGNPMKKDGSWGLSERHLYGNWKLADRECLK